MRKRGKREEGKRGRTDALHVSKTLYLMLIHGYNILRYHTLHAHAIIE